MLWDAPDAFPALAHRMAREIDAVDGDRQEREEETLSLSLSFFSNKKCIFKMKRNNNNDNKKK